MGDAPGSIGTPKRSIEATLHASIKPTQYKAPCAQSIETNLLPPYYTSHALTLSIRCALTRSRIVIWGITAAGAAAAAAPPAPAAAAIAFRPVWCGVSVGVSVGVWTCAAKRRGEGGASNSARVGRWSGDGCDAACLDDASHATTTCIRVWILWPFLVPQQTVPHPPTRRSIDQSVGWAGRGWEGGTGRVVE